MSVEIYNGLINSTFSGRQPPLIPMTPSPTIGDYNVGFIIRAFAKKINTEDIVEVSAKRNTKNNFYIIQNIKWYISGKRNASENDKFKEEGVLEKNLYAIQELERVGFKNIKSILIDPLQFYRGY